MKRATSLVATFSARPYWSDYREWQSGQPMSRFKFLLEQIERARRFAASMTNAGDRDRLEATADGYQRELDTLSSPDARSADASPPSDAVAEPTTPATAAPSDANAATDDGAPSTSGDTGQQETD
jgi:hypothetical protein